MKKKGYQVICLSALLLAVSCGCGRQKYQGSPVILPAREEVVSIGVSDGERCGFSPNTEEEAGEFISEFLSVLMDMDITDKQSVSETPANKEYITINLNGDERTTTLFYYKDGGTEYVEQPYQGIYEPAPALGEYITEMLESAGSDPQAVILQATVIEATDSQILLRPIDGSWELNSADQFSIPNRENLKLQAGDLIEITYNGEILETYPAGLGEIYDIAVMGEE